MNTDNSTETVANKKQYTDKQLRIIQVVLGLISAAALVFAIYMPRLIRLREGDLLNYAFVVVFLIVMIGRRSVENKYRLRLGLFSLTLMIGILGGIIFFVISMLQAPDSTPLWSPQAQIMVMGGLIVLLLVAIIVPFLRYRKRKEAGTLQPIRLPEPKEVEPKTETADADATDEEDYDGPMTIEQKIAAMTRDLDTDKEDKKEE